MSLFTDATLVMDDTTAEVPLDWSPFPAAAATVVAARRRPVPVRARRRALRTLTVGAATVLTGVIVAALPTALPVLQFTLTGGWS